MIFLKGRLYVRVVDGLVEGLFYTNEDIPENYGSFHNEHIAKNRFGDSPEPAFSSYTELSQNGAHTFSGRLIEFREASDECLRDFLSKWDPYRHNLAKWLDNVDHDTHLLIGEKQRLRYIASQFL